MFGMRMQVKEKGREGMDRAGSSSEIANFDSDISSIDFSVGTQRVEHITGVIHLYKKSQSQDAELSSNQICVLAVPSHVGVQDFCALCGPYIKLIKEMRFLRKEKTLEIVYMVYLHFLDTESAQSFFKEHNNQPFCSFEQHVVWKLLYVDNLEFLEGSASTSLQKPGETELPTCPVCLERLDENVSGVVTTVCNHLFHNECLMKWGDTSCPVCRHCMQGISKSCCSNCGVMEDLWICLICGHVGCGRYKSQHAYDHWKETQHCYALELESQRVWDYVGDGYVHRLVQSKTDGKLVEVTCPGESSRRSGTDSQLYIEDSAKVDYDRDEAIVASKIDAIVYEYNHLLTAQLESQRQYFEGVLCQNRLEAEQKLKTLNESLASTSKGLEDCTQDLKEQTKAKKLTLKKFNEATEKVHKVQEEKEFLRQLNETLILNQKEWKEKTELLQKEVESNTLEKDSKINELEDQVRDLIVFIEAQKTVETSELQGASVLPQEQSIHPQATRRRRKKK